jgi:cytochrome c-type biogenesis protein CcmH
MTPKTSKTPRTRRRADEGAAPAATTTGEPARTSLAMKLGVLAFVGVVATGGYLITGSPDAVGVQATTAQAPGQGGHTELAAAVEKLAERLKSEPGDANGWAMLGRSYMVLGRYAEARAAYDRLARLAPDDAGVYADLADAAAMAAGRKLAGEPTNFIERALQLDPDHRKALALAGSAAFDRGDYAAAARHWDRIAELEPEGSEAGRQARAGADEARRRGNLPPGGGAAASAPAAPRVAQARPDAGTQPSTPAAPGAPRVSGTVTLAEALKSRVSPQDTVFIFARPAAGPGAPLAVLRRQVKDLPAAFTLDDSMAMNPGAGISSVPSIVVGARISKSGAPAAQPGDLEGQSAPVSAGASGIRIEIARERP